MEIQKNTWQQGMDAHKKHLQASSIAYQKDIANTMP